GALVLFASEGFYDPANLYVVDDVYTDGDGLARLNLGEGNNYYLNVSCEFGAIPTANTVARVVAEADAVPGKLISVAVAFDGRNHDGTVFPEGHVAVPPASLRSYAQSSGERFDLAIDFSAPREISYGVRRYGDYTGEEYRKSYFEPMADASGVVDLYLLDADNYDRYLAGEPFEAAAVFEQTNALTATRSLPDPAIDWYLVVSNRGRLANAQEIDLQATLTASRPDSEDQGCACRAGDTSGSGAVWILALLFGLARVGALAGRSGSRAGR
ncbi:MAG: hypothetical protein JXR83_14490, partial [Deltaproteobacteria bacterium]|nr:hypothetical protein [Deltaproteobacteria bacterium]